MASNPKMESPIFLCIFQKNFAMANLALKEMGKFPWEVREKSLPRWLSQFSFVKVAIAKFIVEMQKKSGIMKNVLDAMPLFLLDDLLNESINRVSNLQLKLEFNFLII